MPALPTPPTIRPDPPQASPSPTQHLIIAFAVCISADWLAAMKALPPGTTRNTQTLLRGMMRVRSDMQEASSLSPPHERALALAHGLTPAQAANGMMAWAALDAQARLGADGGKAWAWITPCHWSMGREHATLTDPAALALDENASRTLMAAMQPYFATDGITLHYAAPDRWLAEGEMFRALPTASLDRVLGRNVDPWLPDARSARTVRRLQNEMQMLLYTHPVNDERAARRQLPVNSFWLSGTGALPPSAAPAPQGQARVTRALAQAVFNDDWAAYAQAWAALDAGDVARLLTRQNAGETVRLTICGERGFETWASSRQGLLAKTAGLLVSSGVFGLKPIWNGREQL
ncbi:MAG: hypothetical protein B7X59_13445 [Polaromonas sp. 39-63-203]|uniref:hypothetical protein n=1 Tax=Polaromonas sp. TaxID=1869339 RepID=UPI000BD4F5ED|nr:hypothetical protein [Polaromonas sp.]OYY51196.1 MAG: hypothetical protein B7Y54_11145 [Polaromonas sp. 35-63-240]OYZ79301.1 MAG: hypothetical protein B7Y03_13030 [Polaromonas sp. 24-62-144]OZA94600.1 MAG: hypothetical protein B7X59_13445 [Polaromonas sp. 39-63-203]HQS30590.1 hypothetical protein [Polaromonas sp.]HQS90048.1 hypothetical protein [Polaromonas sp.]